MVLNYQVRYKKSKQISINSKKSPNSTNSKTNNTNKQNVHDSKQKLCICKKQPKQSYDDHCIICILYQLLFFFFSFFESFYITAPWNKQREQLPRLQTEACKPQGQEGAFQSAWQTLMWSSSLHSLTAQEQWTRKVEDHHQPLFLAVVVLVFQYYFPKREIEVVL